MNGNNSVFGTIKLCLVLVIVVLSVSFSVLSIGGDRTEKTTNTCVDTEFEAENENQGAESSDTEDITGVDNAIQDAEDKDIVSEDDIFDADEVPYNIMNEGFNIYDSVRLDKLIEQMSYEEKVGQLFFLCVKGRFDESLISTYKVGGILLFGKDVSTETRDSLKAKIDAFQAASDIPLLVGIDEEGGTVSRLNTNSRLIDYIFQSPRDLYARGGFEAIENDSNYKCELLKSYGINVNFAPVCDMSDNPGEYMYPRSFGGDVLLTSEYVGRIVKSMTDNGIGCVLKHFPGYGPNGDTHKAVVYDTRPLSSFVEYDFMPFIAGIENGAGCVLVSHNIVDCMDSELPASLSERVHEILREDLGFEGVIITDDLSMDGVLEYMDNSEAAVQSIIAGNDMIIATYYQEQYNAVLNACKDGRITEERLNDAVRRVLRWKLSLGLDIFDDNIVD